MVVQNVQNGHHHDASHQNGDSLHYEVFQNLSSLISIEFEPVGKWFENYNYLRHQGDVGFEEVESESSSSEEDEAENEETPEYKEYLTTLDPKDWKDQDHYKVLGLEHLRCKATEHQIKRAHKNKVLKHHPDKMKQAGGGSELERDFFACITKSFDILSDPLKRRSYDSVDPTFDDDVPPANATAKTNFFKVFRPVFERNKHWSIKKKVPMIGDENSTFDEVNDFYNFWYDFDSWREFSYLDEESKESAQDRDERRWIDKQNKGARAKRKKEETARIRELVDNAYASDPRIAKFKQDEKKKKEDEKMKKREAARLRDEEENRKVEEIRLAKEKIENEEKEKAEVEKKERESQKKVIKKERKNLRTTVKNFNYFVESENDKISALEEIENLVESLTLNEIQTLNESIVQTGEKKEITKTLITNMKITVRNRIQGITNDEAATKLANEALAAAVAASAPGPSVSAEWCDDEIKLLVKACKVFPIGTRERWEQIAQFIEEHSRGKFKRTGKEVLNKTKEKAKMNPSEKEELNKRAFEKTLQTIKTDATVQEKPSERYSTPGEEILAEQGFNPSPWSVDEQKILEQGLKAFPATLEDRWEKIADTLPSRSKKDCMTRYKELVDIIQAKKKAAQQASQKK